MNKSDRQSTAMSMQQSESLLTENLADIRSQSQMSMSFRDPDACHIPKAPGHQVEAALRVILLQAGPQELLLCQLGQQGRKNWDTKCQNPLIIAAELDFSSESRYFCVLEPTPVVEAERPLSQGQR